MKNAVKMATVLGLMCSAAVAVAPSASASAIAQTCQFGNEYGHVVRGGDLYYGGDLVGTVAVCRDDSYNYWGYLGFREKLTASQWAQATLYRERDSVPAGSVNCDSSGGNGNVGAFQRVCWTPKFSGVSGHYTFLATGELYSSHTGTQLAIGSTGDFDR
ncbi:MULTISPECIES: hypothetical protein [Amycolatopsis]|uniref:hypothetical protein n=1 Tax=Amycolatopsis sp. cg13 TaxID=3238807 RepID=UPI0035248AEE